MTMDMDAIVDTVVERIVSRLETHLVRPRLLSVAQTAVYLGRSDEGIRSLYKSGNLPFIKPDGRVQFDVRDLDKWIESHKA